MKISIVIPAYNEEKLIGKTLAAISEASTAFTSRGWTCETIVCNNNSTDRTAEIATAAGALVVFEPINQISRARNTGGFATTGDWLIFIDADSIPSAALFTEVAHRIQSGRCIGGGCLVKMDEEMFPAWNLLLYLWNLLSRVARWAAGSFIFCEAGAFRELNGFSAKLYASEEIEFSRRLKKLGRRRGLKVTIITHPRLVTSARKVHLYTPAEYGRFMLKAILMPWKVLTNRTDCSPWYDGRR